MSHGYALSLCLFYESQWIPETDTDCHLFILIWFIFQQIVLYPLNICNSFLSSISYLPHSQITPMHIFSCLSPDFHSRLCGKLGWNKLLNWCFFNSVPAIHFPIIPFSLFSHSYLACFWMKSTHEKKVHLTGCLKRTCHLGSGNRCLSNSQFQFIANIFGKLWSHIEGWGC